MSRFDSILLGDNPFFGVDHLSLERGRNRISQSSTFDTAAEVIQYSYQAGVRDMMISPHPNIDDFFDSINKKTGLLDKIYFHPLLPYAQSYVQKLNEKGTIGTLKDILQSDGIKNELKIIARGGFGFFRKDLLDLFKVLLDIEILKLNRVKLKIVYLHPAITDLALALNMKNIFQTFKEHLNDKFKIQAGFCTKNFPRLVDKLCEWQLDDCNIMASFNKLGFQMNPSKNECEDYLHRYKGRVVAMSILAGGYIGLKETYDYISSQEKIRDVIIGVSNVEHAKQSFDLFSKD